MVLYIIQQNTRQQADKDRFMLAVGVSMAYYLCLREFQCFHTNNLVPSSSMSSICWTSVEILRFTIQHAKNIRRGHGVPIWFSTKEDNAEAIAFL